MGDKLNWFARIGTFETLDDGTIKFPGGTRTDATGKPYAEFVSMICNARMENGKLGASFTFEDASKLIAAGLIVREVPEQSSILLAAIGAGGAAFGLQMFNGTTWLQPIFATGDRSAICSNHPYLIEVQMVGAKLKLSIDGIELFQLPLPGTVPASQVGLWMQSGAPVIVRDFTVTPSQKNAFVVMQFSPPYNELFAEVIKPVCKSFEIEAERADEISGPGIILQDIVNRLTEATVTIADITPSNPNVFFEVGFAYALKRPLILIAERGRDLPFDVSGMRTLFYENTIGGKTKIEAELRRHLATIFAQTKTGPNGA